MVYNNLKAFHTIAVQNGSKILFCNSVVELEQLDQWGKMHSNIF